MLKIHIINTRRRAKLDNAYGKADKVSYGPYITWLIYEVQTNGYTYLNKKHIYVDMLCHSAVNFSYVSGTG